MRIGSMGAGAVLVLAGLTACASTGAASGTSEGPAAAASGEARAATKASSAASIPAAAAYEWETWPPPGEVREVERAAPTGEIVEIKFAPQGMSALELLSLVSEKTGAVLLYDDQSNQKLKTCRIQAVGTWRVPRSGLMDMCRAALSQQNMLAIPVGSAVGGEVWSVMDMNNPMVKTHPTWIPENAILGYADCDGLYVVTTFRVRDTVDTGRLRQALTSLVTQTASIGRIQDVPGSRTIVVGDFAPVVAAMKRVVDEVNRTATYPLPPATQPPGR